VIFCRNLLIYFDRPTQDRAVSVLERLLTSNGTLFVAPSETGLLLCHDFVSAKIPLAFAFRKSGAGLPRDPKPAARRAGRSTRFPVAPPAPATRTSRRPTRENLVPTGKTLTNAPPPLESTDRQAGVHAGLDEAVRLANQGSFAEAATCCEQHVRQYGPSANAFHLLGLVRDAAGNPADASKYYRKALYLDPEHHETLVHFAFLVEQQGDRAGAQVLRNRARRVEQNGKV
jgi:chemotaxis protein methyltransferase WspC